MITVTVQIDDNSLTENGYNRLSDVVANAIESGEIRAAIYDALKEEHLPGEIADVISIKVF